MKRVWQIPGDVRTVHLGAFTPEHGAEICRLLEESGIACWAKTPSGFTRLWEREVHVFVDRVKLTAAQAIAEGVLGGRASEP